MHPAVTSVHLRVVVVFCVDLAKEDPGIDVFSISLHLCFGGQHSLTQTTLQMSHNASHISLRSSRQHTRANRSDARASASALLRNGLLVAKVYALSSSSMGPYAIWR